MQVDSSLFKGAVYTGILLNTVQLGIQTDYSCGTMLVFPDGEVVPKTHPDVCVPDNVFEILDFIFLSFFTLEMIVKIYALRLLAPAHSGR